MYQIRIALLTIAILSLPLLTTTPVRAATDPTPPVQSNCQIKRDLLGEKLLVQAIYLAEKSIEPQQKANGMFRIADIYKCWQEPKLTAKYIQAAIDLTKQISNPLIQVGLLSSMAESPTIGAAFREDTISSLDRAWLWLQKQPPSPEKTSSLAGLGDLAAQFGRFELAGQIADRSDDPTVRSSSKQFCFERAMDYWTKAGNSTQLFQLLEKTDLVALTETTSLEAQIEQKFGVKLSLKSKQQLIQIVRLVGLVTTPGVAKESAFRQRIMAEAMRVFKQIAPGDSQLIARGAIAFGLVEVGNKAEAKSQISILLPQLKSKFGESSTGIATTLLLKVGDLKLATQLVDELVQSPTSLTAKINVLSILFDEPNKLDRSPQEKSILTQIVTKLAQHPDLDKTVEAQLLLISGYQSIGQPKTAAIVAKRTIELPLAQWQKEIDRLFKVFDEAGETAAALKVAKISANGENPSNELLKQLVRSTAAAGKFDQARSLMAMNELKTAQPELLATLAQAYAKAGKTQLATQTITEAFNLAQKLTEPDYTLSSVLRTYLETGNLEVAIDLARKVADPQRRFNLLADVLQAPLMGYNLLEAIPAAQQPNEGKITPAQIQIWTVSALEISNPEQRDRAFRYITMKHIHRGEYPQAFQAVQNIKGSKLRFDTLIRSIEQRTTTSTR
jgi:tetratricopeptide (TPR) repeat protein